MFCKHCGMQMQEDAAFCSNCGTLIGKGQQKEMQESSKPQKPAKKAGNISAKRKALIGTGAGIGVIGLLMLLMFIIFYNPEWEEKVFDDVIFYSSEWEGEVSDDGTVVVHYIGAGGAVAIPSIIRVESKFYLVTSIGEGTFHFGGGEEKIVRERITSIEIPGSVTSIGDKAFAGCIRLTSIKIPNSVTSIGEQAFGLCVNLTSIKIPGSVTSIGDSAFSRCFSLTSVRIPDSVTSIGDYVFYGCSLTNIELTDYLNLEYMGENAFVGCSLEYITIAGEKVYVK